MSTTDIVADPRGCFAEDLPTLLVSFARSGDSPESVAATELAEQCLSEVHHLVITCNEQGQLAREHSGRTTSYVLLMPPESNDRGFAMTSSFTGMTLAALLALGGDPRRCHRSGWPRRPSASCIDAVLGENIDALAGPRARADRLPGQRGAAGAGRGVGAEGAAN